MNKENLGNNLRELNCNRKFFEQETYPDEVVANKGKYNIYVFVDIIENV